MNYRNHHHHIQFAHDGATAHRMLDMVESAMSSKESLVASEAASTYRRQSMASHSDTTDMFPTLDDIDTPQTTLVRVDINSPLVEGTVQDNHRFARHVVTLSELANAEHRVLVLAHQGRPGDDDFVSLEQHAEILSGYLDRHVRFCPATWGAPVEEAVKALPPGGVLVLENVRMLEDELADRSADEHASVPFVQSLANIADAYIGDAYSTAHRSHASIVGLPTAMNDVYAGRVMEREFTANSSILSRDFEGHVVMVLGGTKADDLLRVIEGVTDRVDTFLLGGVIGELCLRAKGYDLGFDLGEKDMYDPIWETHESTLRHLVNSQHDRLVLPVDLAYANARGEREERDVAGIEKDAPYFDVGSNTSELFAEYIANASAVFVKGSLGVFEDERFSNGTVRALRAIGESDAFSVIGGGDTSRALELYDLDPTQYDHVSIAGGAYVSALAGEDLPGVDVLRR